MPWLLCGAQTPLLKWGKATQVTQDTRPHGDAQPTEIFLSSFSSGIEKNMMFFFFFYWEAPVSWIAGCVFLKVLLIFILKIHQICITYIFALLNKWPLKMVFVKKGCRCSEFVTHTTLPLSCLFSVLLLPLHLFLFLWVMSMLGLLHFDVVPVMMNL